ncbi:AtpZ/AtpI family protein [Chryseolinea lacunae]|uniref:AtpZ/AtpI family protein n=1 Tax=Chryseolinea lacunae TaxID=2801331 RepID=A0ABS1KRS8_9BACT|nr:AtpZ/AtpI family protein [Chryseolinea lacunae]MBL0742156.1 AtpZ/AtpI family protein [Chryseolinea lacunae]
MGLTEPSPKKKLKTYNSYLKYSSLGIQLLVVMGVFGWLGYLLDRYLALKIPVFMLLFGFLAFGGMMFQVYRSINRDNS